MPSLAAFAAAFAASSMNAIPPNLANITYLTEAAQQQGAVCLDGSPSAYYIRHEAEAKKFYVRPRQ
jgi:hypothetical protein